MARRDYILCRCCECKLVYDGYDNIRDALDSSYGNHDLLCPSCSSAIIDLGKKYKAALEQIKLYHENMHGAKASTFIAYDIACKALEEA